MCTSVSAARRPRPKRTFAVLSCHRVKLEAFHKFADSTEALKAVAKMLKGKIPTSLKTFLDENVISKEIRDTIICMILPPNRRNDRW